MRGLHCHTTGPLRSRVRVGVVYTCDVASTQHHTGHRLLRSSMNILAAGAGSRLLHVWPLLTFTRRVIPSKMQGTSVTRTGFFCCYVSSSASPALHPCCLQVNQHSLQDQVAKLKMMVLWWFPLLGQMGRASWQC